MPSAHPSPASHSPGPENLRSASPTIRHRYQELLGRFHILAGAYRRLSKAYKKVITHYRDLRSRYLQLFQRSSRAVQALEKRATDRTHDLVLTEDRRLVKVSPDLMTLLDTEAKTFARSIYLEILFQKYLPPPPPGPESKVFEPFVFPILPEEDPDPDSPLHPFIHLEMRGLARWMPQRGKHWYYIKVRDVSSQVELDYFTKTDRTIQQLSLANDRLLQAKTTIEVHKRMLISLTCSLIGNYSWETSAHLATMRRITELLSAECLRRGLVPPGPRDLQEYIQDINYTSVLHDIGKMAVPAEILNKPGPLDPDERKIMAAHPLIGASYIRKIMDEFSDGPWYDQARPFLQIPLDICLCHHEHWDGSGYPHGLSGFEIPFPARLVAVADTYDAMRGQRPYNPVPKTHQEAMDELRTYAGRQFDPDLVEAMEALSLKLQALYPS